MMATPLAAVLCTILLVLCLGGGVLSDTENHPQIVDSVRVQIVSKQDHDGKWVNEVKLEHGTEQAPWKVEVEQKTIDRGGRQSVELTATLTGSKPSPQPAVAPRILAGSIALPTLGPLPVAEPQTHPGSFPVPFVSPFHGNQPDNEAQEVHTSWRGSYYILHTNRVDWVTANKTCADSGAHLAIINSDEEASFFTDMLKGFPSAYLGASVGITDEGQEGEWVTIDGVSIASAGFARWFREDQPDNANGNENCGAYFPTYRGLNDVPCTGYLMLTICEKDDETPRINESEEMKLGEITTRDYWMGSFSTNFFEPMEDDDYDMLLHEELEQQEPDEPAGDYTQFEGFSSLYKIHTEQMDWETANATCVEEGAHLAVINSEEEAKMLAMLLDRLYDNAYRGAFVGITDEAEEGIWLTIFGETLAQAGFARWFRDDQPDNANGNENCGAIFPSNGGFNDVPCTIYLMHSICEKDSEPERTTLRSLESDSLLATTTSEPEDIDAETEQPTFDDSEYIISSNEMMTTQRNDVITMDYPTTLGYEQYTDRNYYKLHADAGKTWEEAQKACRMEGGTLARVTSIEVFPFLRNMMARASLNESDLVFVEFGNKNFIESYPDDFEYTDSGSGPEICSALNAIKGRTEIVQCQIRLHFICEISLVRDEPAEESTDKVEQSEDFSNSVDLPLSNDDASRGFMTILKYISLKRDDKMATSPPMVQLDDEDILWSETESGHDMFEYVDEGEWF